MKKKLVLFGFLFVSTLATAQFVSQTTKQIDIIQNNTANDIVLDPNSTVKVNNLTGGFALQSGSLKELEESAVTNTELGYVSGVTSPIQTQIDTKLTEPTGLVDGDTLYFRLGVWNRLAIGTPNFVLTATAAGIPNWQALPDLSPTTTAGDIIYNDAGGNATDTRLPIGTNGQILTVDSGFPSWQDAPETSPLTTKGDIYTYDTGNQRLGVGTNGQILSANSAEGTGLEWIDPPSSTPTTTEGDLIVRGATEDERLGIGTNGQLLTSNGTTATWQDAPTSVSVTTKGDLQGHNPSAPARIPVGQDGQQLYADSTNTNGLEYRSPNENINYIENFDAISSTTGWTTYKDTGSIPVDGTSGSPTITYTRNFTTPLRGSGDFQLTKDAADRQGEGFAYDFTIANADQAKKLTISFEYDASDANYNDGDIGIFVYDITNAELIRVNGESLFGGKGTYYGQFQTSANSTSYRLIGHITSTNAAAYNVFFDSFNVSATRTTNGSINTDWVEFTPTGTWTSNSNYTGRYRRVGDTAEIQVLITLSGTPNTSNLSVNLPSGLVMDTSKLLADNASFTALSSSIFGIGSLADSGGALYNAYVGYSNSTTVTIIRDNGIADTRNNIVSATTPFAWASGDTVNVTFSVPISGWSSNSKTSENFGARDVFVSGKGNNGATINASTNINFTEVEDTTASWNGSLFTAPESGTYDISGSLFFTSSASYALSANINGTNQDILNTIINASIISFQGTVKLSKGDTLAIRQNQASATLSNSTTAHTITISKKSTPQTILETEEVSARYRSNSGQSVATNTTVVFEDRIHDTHNAYNTSNGIYTVPVSGTYQISASIATNSVSWSTGQFFNIVVDSNGSTQSNAYKRIQASFTSGMSVSNSTAIKLSKGDQIEIVSSASRGSTPLTTQSDLNAFSIVRIK